MKKVTFVAAMIAASVAAQAQYTAETPYLEPIANNAANSVFDVVILNELPDFVEFSLTHESARVRVVDALQKSFDRLRTGSLGEEGKFAEIFVGFQLALRLGNKPDEDSAFANIVHFRFVNHS